MGKAERKEAKVERDEMKKVTTKVKEAKEAEAAWKAYEERTLAVLKQEKPGLKMSQYKDMMWKTWQKSPDNPINQTTLADSDRWQPDRIARMAAAAPEHGGGKEDGKEDEKDCAWCKIMKDKICKAEYDDAYWSAQGENDKSKASKKKEEEERKRAETAAKKAEAKRLADAELEELGKAKAKAEKAGSQKVTHFQLQQQKEFEDRTRLEEQTERDLASRRELSAEQYARQTFDACMESQQGDEKCMPLFEALRACMAQKPSLATMLRGMLTGGGGSGGQR
ncbi:Coiled-coil domain-containing protein 124 [Tetrabaena socialis]|uniref:Coiled-coil domain-containing protein 124 n=1 Tax=Tetrabaena socialis TaxID=47790 RepID=A0A2J8AFR9_9CHLO|nr:Coiled-coil domain-containing protein 124 [Tetrabaena socialis]|eukprot:PNH11365.1 Coiled-coil domain-containing protein 124 [Tetrabaena socialis]